MANALRPGQGRELQALTQQLMPVVRARVTRVLASVRSVRAEAEDFVQEVFAQLFENSARILRAWNPDRGASLQNYVGLVAERRVRSLLRLGRVTQWREQLSTTPELESHAMPVESPARMTAEHQYAARIIGAAQTRLSRRGSRMLDILLIQQRTVSEAVELTGMSTASIYAWRSRLQKLLRELARELRVADLH